MRKKTNCQGELETLTRRHPYFLLAAWHPSLQTACCNAYSGVAHFKSTKGTYLNLPDCSFSHSFSRYDLIQMESAAFGSKSDRVFEAQNNSPLVGASKRGKAMGSPRLLGVPF